jgi:hypothetical protein
MPWMTFNYIGDETQVLSCSPGSLIALIRGHRRVEHADPYDQQAYGSATYGGFYGLEILVGKQRRLPAGESRGQPFGW